MASSGKRVDSIGRDGSQALATEQACFYSRPVSLQACSISLKCPFKTAKHKNKSSRPPFCVALCLSQELSLDKLREAGAVGTAPTYSFPHLYKRSCRCTTPLSGPEDSLGNPNSSDFDLLKPALRCFAQQTSCPPTQGSASEQAQRKGRHCRSSI